jgi:hypothetical protein
MEAALDLAHGVAYEPRVRRRGAGVAAGVDGAGFAFPTGGRAPGGWAEAGWRLAGWRARGPVVGRGAGVG